MYRNWLPDVNVSELIRSTEENDTNLLSSLQKIARTNHDFASGIKIDRFFRRKIETAASSAFHGLQHIKLAIMSTSTTNHLPPGIRVAGLGRGFNIEVFEPSYGQVRQEIADRNSDLHKFSPTCVLFANDPYSIFPFPPSGALTAAEPQIASAVAELRGQWRSAKEFWKAQVIQQLPFDPFPRLMGENERLLPGSPSSSLEEFRAQISAAAAEEGVQVIDLKRWTEKHGREAWHSSSLWHRSKQEIHPAMAPFYGDLVARTIAAQFGRSAKCLVLDLDNTLWGGVIGDDGLGGIQLGQGSAAGESFIAFQKYARLLSSRGVILAVCSKNDESVAKAAFEKHPDMVLKLDDISCFVANWDDKAKNIRDIAKRLNIGLDAIVFADDNPFERNLVRDEIPGVMVPELSDDPAEYAAIISESGFFENVSITSEDLAKNEQYRSNAQREQLLSEETDLESYLAKLDMTLSYKAIDEFSLPRFVQLINKTNQFNLTTRRYTDSEARALIGDQSAVALQLRLVDRFGDNGIIGVVIGKAGSNPDMLEIDTWLMSCRVLGRQVEQATLNVLAQAAAAKGIKTLIGKYIPSDRNAMVEGHYERLGFQQHGADGPVQLWALDIPSYSTIETHIRIEEAK